MRSKSVRDDDITPGFMFAFDYDDDAFPGADPYASGTYVVITSRWHTNIAGGYHKHLCLGPWGSLEWLTFFGKVYIIVDPRASQNDTGGQ